MSKLEDNGPKYGFAGNVNFPETSLISIYDAENNIVKCAKCDKKATCAVQGYNAYIAYCEDHGTQQEES